MADSENRKRKPGRPRGTGKDAPEMRVVGIDFNPGPDAEERLRKLFTFLVRLVDDDLPSPIKGSPPDKCGEEEC